MFNNDFTSEDKFLLKNHKRDKSYAKSSGIKWHKAKLSWGYFKTYEQHKRESSTNSNAMRMMKLYTSHLSVLHSSYNHICCIFANVIVEVWPQSKQVEFMNLKYKIYFNHKTENSTITECVDYSIIPTHVNIVWRCRSMQAAM